jgi:hypothetical protein
MEFFNGAEMICSNQQIMKYSYLTIFLSLDMEMIDDVYTCINQCLHAFGDSCDIKGGFAESFNFIWSLGCRHWIFLYPEQSRIPSGQVFDDNKWQSENIEK